MVPFLNCNTEKERVSTGKSKLDKFSHPRPRQHASRRSGVGGQVGFAQMLCPVSARVLPQEANSSLRVAGMG